MEWNPSFVILKKLVELIKDPRPPPPPAPLKGPAFQHILDPPLKQPYSTIFIKSVFI